MGIFSWLVLGFLAGAIAGRITRRPTSGCVTRIAVGILGAFIGGALARAAGYEGVTELGMRSVVVATLGATLLLFGLEALGGGRRRSLR